MKFNEIIEQLKPFEGTEEFENYIGGQVTADRVTKYLATDDGKKYIQPQLDKYHNKSLESWKKNNLDALVDAKVKELYPDQTPEQKELAELKAKFKDLEAKSLRSELTAHAIKVATAKNLPTDLMTYLIGENEATTDENIEKFATAFNAAVEKMVKARLGDAHKPDAGDNSKELTPEELNALSIEEINKYYNELSKKK